MSPQDTVRSVLACKGGTVWSIGPHATVYEAIEIMAEREIGSMPVIDNSGDDPSDASRNQCISARPSPSLMRTRLQVDVEGRAARSRSCLLKSQHFGMFDPFVGVGSRPDYMTVLIDYDGANIGIR